MVEMRGHFGAFYHHHFEMKRFDAHFPAFEASFYKSTFGQHEWEATYNYPYIGFTLYRANYDHNLEGNPEVGEALGDVTAVYPFINYPLITHNESQLTLKVGAGLGWLSKTFHPIENHYNLSIGSRLNAAINLSFEYRQQFGNSLMSVASLGLTHFSNGATKSPNYGLNTISGALGLAYYLRGARQNLTPSKRPDYHPFEFDGKKWFYVDVTYGIGVKDVSQTLGKDERYTVHDFSVMALAKITPNSSAGLDFNLTQDYSDQALKDHYVDDNGAIYIIQKYYEQDHYLTDTVSIKAYQMVKPSFGLCYQMTMDRLSFNFELGVHIDLRNRIGEGGERRFVTETQNGKLVIPAWNLATDVSKGQYYERIGIRYHLFHNTYASITLTAHAIRADMLCFGLSYRFNNKYYFNHEKSYRHPPGLH